jgi:hypothetical protein
MSSERKTNVFSNLERSKMSSPNPPDRADLPSLPQGCEELYRTANPTRDRLLEQYLDDFPALGEAEFDRLNAIATKSGSVPTEGALGLSDLLRSRQDGSHALHPRTVHVLPSNTIDSVLTRLADRVDEDIAYDAHQYPEYLAECDTDSPSCPSIYPEDYRIEVIDLVRDLRANNVLTSVRERGQPACKTTSLKTTVKQLESRNNIVEGVTTLLRADEGGKYERPLLIVEDREASLGRRPPHEILDLSETLKTRFVAPVSIQKASRLDRLPESL